MPTNRTHTVPCTHAHTPTCDQVRKSTPKTQTSTQTLALLTWSKAWSIDPPVLLSACSSPHRSQVHAQTRREYHGQRTTRTLLSHNSSRRNKNKRYSPLKPKPNHHWTGVVGAPPWTRPLRSPWRQGFRVRWWIAARTWRNDRMHSLCTFWVLGMGATDTGTTELTVLAEIVPST